MTFVRGSCFSTEDPKRWPMGAGATGNLQIRGTRIVRQQ
jgi:hypothetical protein